MGKQVSVYLDEEVIKDIEEISKKRDRSFSYIVNSFLGQVLSKEIQNE